MRLAIPPGETINDMLEDKSLKEMPDGISFKHELMP